MHEQRYDQRTAEVLVFTFREGLLSAVAHDLKLKVGRFEVTLSGQHLRAEFDAASLEVVCARQEGRDAPKALPGFARPEIERNVRNDVLRPAQFPRIVFQSTALGDAEVVGQLTLAGITRELHCRRRDEGDFLVAEAAFDQRDFGLKPYSAMLGTLKVKPEVRVQVRLPKSMPVTSAGA